MFCGLFGMVIVVLWSSIEYFLFACSALVRSLGTTNKRVWFILKLRLGIKYKWIFISFPVGIVVRCRNFFGYCKQIIFTIDTCSLVKENKFRAQQFCKHSSEMLWSLKIGNLRFRIYKRIFWIILKWFEGEQTRNKEFKNFCLFL